MSVTKQIEHRGYLHIIQCIICVTICGIFLQFLWMKTFVYYHIPANYQLEKPRFLSNAIEGSYPFSKTANLLELARKRYTINCSNIEDIKLGRKLGMGNFKTTFIGYFRGMKVAVKVPNENLTVDALNACIKRIFAPAQKEGTAEAVRACLSSSCNLWTASQFLHEILNHAVLNFTGITQNLGYCIGYNFTGTNSEVFSRGIVSVFEYGSPLHLRELTDAPLIGRIRHCRDLAKLILELQFSAVGSVAYTDFHFRHFKMADGRIKVIDMDDWVTPVEPRCGPRSDLTIEDLRQYRVQNKYNVTCKFGVQCVDGQCLGNNVMENVYNFVDKFFAALLKKDSFAETFYERHKDFLDDMLNYRLAPTDMYNGFELLVQETRNDGPSS